MLDFGSDIFQPCREWLGEKINEGIEWDELEKLCVSDAEFESRMQFMQDDELWPLGLTKEAWKEYVDYYRGQLISVRIVEEKDVVAIDNGTLANKYVAQYGPTSSWDNYRKYLTSKMSAESIADLQKSCVWVLNHLLEDTREYGEVKGLVTGSVQSGKTANMEGLISMAADYDWNFFIILSGSIDNLRIQTRDRFKKDLKNAEGILWNIIDFTADDKKMLQNELKLNNLSGAKNYANRYLTVCLKNRKRLETLIEWLYSDPQRTKKLRVIVIDDEADQASINTAEITEEEYQERCAINQMIVNLVNGKKSDGSIPSVKFQSINYISYTATPYANVLNEGPGESLYPKDFICTLPESHEYFGAKVIFGNDEEDCPGFPIIRRISPGDEDELKKVHKEQTRTLPMSIKDSIAWFLCAAAIQRRRGIVKPISMLIHTAPRQGYHFVIYERIQAWLSKKTEVLSRCKYVFSVESRSVTKEDLREANPDYGFLDEVYDSFPKIDEILPEVENLLDEITNIQLDDEKKVEFTTGIHLCVDNCRANREADEGTYLRIIYPTDEQLSQMKKAPVFIVIGGNTLSRGLTIEGLVCTYFSRTSNQADTLMQMARWFGYRRGYELLQRIWMTDDALRKFEAMTKIDMDLKREVERFMEHGISPSKFGPRIRNIPEITKFRVTSKKKSQMAEYDDFDFCGDSYETTDFDDNYVLDENIKVADKLVTILGSNGSPRISKAAKAVIWDQIPYPILRDDFLNHYKISKHSHLYNDLPCFSQWIDSMNSEGKLINWNVAVIDGDNHESEWKLNDDIKVGKIERTRKKDVEHIDIGSLRSGLDALCDVEEGSLNSEQQKVYDEVRKTKKDIISKRSDLNLGDNPLLLIYRIKKDGGIPRANSTRRIKMDARNDIIGISIIVPGDSIGESHAKSLRIKIEEDILDA